MINTAQIIVAVDTVDFENTTDEWYRKRYREVISNPHKFNGRLWEVILFETHESNFRDSRRPRSLENSDTERIPSGSFEGVPRHAAGRLFRYRENIPASLFRTFGRICFDVTEYIKRCDLCQRTKVEQAGPAGLMRRRIADGPWTVVAIDIIDPLPRSKAGFQYILVIQDLFTKWVECKPLRASAGCKIGEALEELVISRWGASKFLLTDNGTEFLNKIIKAFTENYNITHTTVPPYHP